MASAWAVTLCGAGGLGRFRAWPDRLGGGGGGIAEGAEQNELATAAPAVAGPRDCARTSLSYSFIAGDRGRSPVAPPLQTLSKNWSPECDRSSRASARSPRATPYTAKILPATLSLAPCSDPLSAATLQLIAKTDPVYPTEVRPPSPPLHSGTVSLWRAPALALKE